MKSYNSQAIAADWAAKMQNATEKMKRGVDGVTENPAEKAAAAAPQWLAGVQRAAAEGSFESGLRKVSLADWKSKMKAKGIPNMATGAREAQSDFQRFLTDFLPFAGQVSDEIKAMPKGTKEDSRARMNAAFEKMSSYKRRS